MFPYYKHLAKSLRWILLAELDSNHDSCYAVAHYPLSSSLFLRADCTNKLYKKWPFLCDTPDYFHMLEDVWEFQVSVTVQTPNGRGGGGADTITLCPVKIIIQHCVNKVHFCVFWVLFMLYAESTSTASQSAAHSQGCPLKSSFLLN